MELQPRPFERIARVVDVGEAKPSLQILIGEEVMLLPAGDAPENGSWVIARVTRLTTNGRMAGIITRSNRRGARGEPGYERGAVVIFEEQHVWHLAP